MISSRQASRYVHPVFFLGLMMILAACVTALPSGPGVWIDSPLDGSVLMSADPVEIIAHASAAGGLSELILKVNGETVHSQSYTAEEGEFVEFRHQWSAGPGEYALQIRAVDMDGNESPPAVVHVSLVGTLPDSAVTPSVTPTAGGTMTVTPSPETTQTATGTTPPSVQVNFRADDTSIVKGNCTTLRWDTENATSVALDGAGVSLDGSKQVCPVSTTSYYLHVESPDGPVDRSVTISVQVPTATLTPTTAPTSTPDTFPPVISSITESADPIRPPSCSPDSVLISATITDPAGIAKQELHFQVTSGSTQGSWVWRTMNSIGGDVYQTSIGHDQLKSSLFPYEGDNTYVSYYIKAWDKKANMTQSTTGNVTVIFCVP